MTSPASPQAIEQAPQTMAATSSTGPWWSRLEPKTRAALVVAEVALILLVWQIAQGVLELANPVFLPPPSRILDGFGELFANPDLARHVWTTLLSWTIGYVLAVIVGVSLGVLVGRSLPVDRLAGPLLWILYATPWLAYRPLSLVWFGFGMAPIVFLVFIAAIFPTLFNTAVGVRTADKSLLAAGQVFGTSRFDTYRKILLPAALPFMLVGMRQSVVVASIALIIAEMLGSSVGLGAMMAIQTNRYQTDQVFALVIIAVLWTVILSQLLKILGERLAPWQTDSREA